jgi:thiamine biosynthesis lipoprotein
MRRVLIPALAAPPVARPGRLRRLEGRSMGTSWSVRWVESGGATDPRPDIERELDSVIAQMSGWLADSHLCRFNRAPAGSWLDLPDGFFAVLHCALVIAARTGGAFDPAIGRLVDLWGFGAQPVLSDAPPDAGHLATLRQAPGWRDIRLDPSRRRALQPGGVALDLAGIAKGYAVDQVAEALARLGLAAFLVELGGELRGHGVKPGGEPWWVALETPPEEVLLAGDCVAALHGMAIATSGDYRRCFRHGGRRYGHTIDPRSGWPIEDHVAAVTVLHRSCMQADALATALAVLGPRAGLQHAAEHGIAARFLTRDADGLRERMSPAMAAMLD